MPYSGPGDATLPDSVQALSNDKRTQWVAVFNSAFEKCQDDDGDDCEGAAFRQANGVVFDEMALFTPPAELGIDGQLSARAVRRLAEDGVSWARKVVRKLDKAKKASMEKTATKEMYDDDTPQVAGMATSFVDLQAAQQANEAAEQIHKLTYQFQTLVENIMYDQGVTDKGTAIESLAGEFVDLARMAFGSEVEEAAPELVAELAELEFAESAIGHVTRLVEAGDVATGGSKPLLLEISPIKPGWGNKRDNNYYPSDVLERDFARAFDGVKMYETNHVDSETNNKNWVSTYIETARFDDGAPVGNVGIHNPHFAQKVLNLYELEQTTGKPLLRKLECSIRGGGMAMPGFELDGREGKQVKELSEGRSIDWVSRAGAGGHATRLLESEEEMSEKVTEKELEKNDAAQAASVEEVKIEEKAQVEPGPVQAEPVAPQEVAPVEPEPTFLGEAEVKALVPDHLPDETKARLFERQFPDEDEARRVIAIEIEYLMAVTNSGKPVMAEKSQPAPVVNITEMAKEQQARQSNVNKQFLGG